MILLAPLALLLGLLVRRFLLELALALVLLPRPPQAELMELRVGMVLALALAPLAMVLPVLVAILACSVVSLLVARSIRLPLGAAGKAAEAIAAGNLVCAMPRAGRD